MSVCLYVDGDDPAQERGEERIAGVVSVHLVCPSPSAQALVSSACWKGS